MDFWSKWYCIVGSISGGNCNASQSRHWWLWRNMQWISGQNRIILLKVFLLEIALHRWQGSGGIGGKCNGFLVKMVLYCWKYFWCKLQCIPFQTLVVLEEYEMDFWSKLYCIVGSISGGNCIASLARHIGGSKGICNEFLVKIMLCCWKYLWCKLQCIPFPTLVVLEEYAMDFPSGLLCIVGNISGGNCNASLARQWWYWGEFNAFLVKIILYCLKYF